MRGKYNLNVGMSKKYFRKVLLFNFSGIVSSLRDLGLLADTFMLQ